MLTTFFAGEIISMKRPFLTRKWDADEDVDRKHWVGILVVCNKDIMHLPLTLPTADNTKIVTILAVVNNVYYTFINNFHITGL